MEVYINTLGSFDISYEGKSILQEASRSYKLQKLFQYFLTFRGRKLLPDTIIDNLWQDDESSDPRNVLRTQIFRLRKSFKSILPAGADETDYFAIKFYSGYYCFELGESATLDVMKFDSYIERAEEFKSINIDETANLYKNALKLYKGHYLPENAYESWLVPVRNYYERLYLKTLFSLIEILKEKEDNNEIIEICEEASAILPYEEAIHINIIDAMLKTGQIMNAMNHYEYANTLLHKEMGINSSPGLRSIYRKIQNYNKEKNETGIENIKDKMKESNVKGAFLCDSDYFKFLINIQNRRELRDESKDVMGLITLTNNNEEYIDEIDTKKRMSTITEVLTKSLRKGDVFSFWNDTQILVLFHKAKENSVSEIEERIKDNFKKKKDCDLQVNVKFLSLTKENI